MLAHKNPYVGYRDFVLQGDNADTDKCYSAEKRVILIKPRGRPKRNVARQKAMYCYHRLGDHSLVQIVSYFSLTNIGLVSKAIYVI